MAATQRRAAPNDSVSAHARARSHKLGWRMTALTVGRCMCGEVKFQAKGEPKCVLWCRCQSCRRHTGAGWR